MRKIILISLIALLLPACAHKIIGKNCEKSQSSEYFVCDSLGLTGR